MEELHGCSTAELWNELYESVKEHLLADATEDMKAYVAYFDRQWIRSRFCNWQRFSMPDGYSVTNNPCETFNKILKQSYMRKRVVIAELLTDLTSAVRNISKDMNPIPPPQDHHLIRKQSLLRQLVASAKAISVRRNIFVAVPNVEGTYIYHAAGRAALPADASRLLRVRYRLRQYLVTAGTQEKRGTCTCYMYRDKRLCKHVLALRFHLSIEKPISSPKRAVGRPRKRLRAWERQEE